MKKNSQKITKGAPSAVLISILIHVGLFLGAGIFVVFTVLPTKEVKFEPPPPVKHPKMPIKKLQIRTKKPSKPKSTAKLTAVVQKVDLQEIAFPDLPTSGIGTGIGSGADGVGFMDLPDLGDDDGILGKEKSIGNDLEGTYYDIKRTRSGNYNGETQDTFRDTIRKFLNNDWNTTAFTRFYRSPKKRYATCLMVPTLPSSIAPTAFGEDPGSGFFWMVHYKGKIVYPEDITFRFWGVGDEILAVRVNRKVVFADVWKGDRWRYGNFWQGNDPQRKQYLLGYDTSMEVGDWVTLEAGVPQEIEILVGDNGGLAALMLLVEVKGVKYPQNIQAGPILPIFKTSELSHDLIDAIYKDLSPNECCLTNGPVFRDY